MMFPAALAALKKATSLLAGLQMMMNERTDD